MVCKTQARNPHEARCQIRLPRGGHVTRLTLWVNGEPREAAFNAVSKVKSAYKAVAVVEQDRPVRRREPVAPVVASLVGQVELGLGAGRQLAGAGAEVGVNVGLGDVGDATLERGGEGARTRGGDLKNLVAAAVLTGIVVTAGAVFTAS